MRPKFPHFAISARHDTDSVLGACPTPRHAPVRRARRGRNWSRLDSDEGDGLRDGSETDGQRFGAPGATGISGGSVSACLPGLAIRRDGERVSHHACQADRENYSTQAFEDFSTRGMLWRRACNPEGPGLRGLVTANVVRPGTVERGARSLFVLRAPPGTRFKHFSWSGGAQRTDCRYALHIWAYRPDGPTTAIKMCARTKCVPPRQGQIAGWPKPALCVTGAQNRAALFCRASLESPLLTQARTPSHITRRRGGDVSPPTSAS